MSTDQELAGFEAFDMLATMVAIASPQGQCLLANSALENAVGVSRRALQRGNVLDWLTDPTPLRETLRAVGRNEVATGRFDALMKRMPHGSPELPVHVIVTQMDRSERTLIELIEIEQQTRLDREERSHGLAQANKELVRNLAHEIKNPLGGTEAGPSEPLRARESLPKACPPACGQAARSARVPQ